MVLHYVNLGCFLLFCLVNSFIFLFLENYGVRKLEAVFAVLIATMALSFAWMFGDTQPNGKELLLGKKLFSIKADCSLVDPFLLFKLLLSFGFH